MTGSAVAQVAAALGFAAVAALLAWRLRLGLAWPIVRAAARATLQLGVVGLLIALIFQHPPLAIVFVAGMIATAAMTSGGRIGVVTGSRRYAAGAIALPALTATAVLLAVGAFEAAPEAAIPTAGILIGGAMAATTLTGRRLIEGLVDEHDELETRLSLGDDVRTAVAPLVRKAITTGLVPAIDQTRAAGLVTLPGTFVGLLLGGASPETAARAQLVVLLAVLAVQVVAGLLISEAIIRRLTVSGAERLDVPRTARD